MDATLGLVTSKGSLFVARAMKQYHAVALPKRGGGILSMMIKFEIVDSMEEIVGGNGHRVETLVDSLMVITMT